jgi:hypothetical protein
LVVERLGNLTEGLARLARVHGIGTRGVSGDGDPFNVNSERVVS